MKVRFRKDGILFAQWFIPIELHKNLFNRIKVMAGMDLAQAKKPQDGSISYENILPTGVDIRVSVVPSLFGERIVLRLLDKHRGLFKPSLLGMADDYLALFHKKIHSPHGLILLTGPTGSGKTTSIYAALNTLNTEKRCIITIEDPIEYELSGINQIQVDARLGLTYAEAFRAILRQNPDVVLLGEIRDADSAQVATDASGTGHLVVSTLHTNDAVHAIPRLLALGCDPHVLAGSLQLIVAQRLVRRLCPACKRPEPLDDDRLIELGFDVESVDGVDFFAPAGCPECNGLGYLGRVGAFEMLALDQTMREMILSNEPAPHIFRHARQNGMRTIREDALRLARTGITSLEEVSRITGGQ